MTERTLSRVIDELVVTLRKHTEVVAFGRQQNLTGIYLTIQRKMGEVAGAYLYHGYEDGVDTSGPFNDAIKETADQLRTLLTDKFEFELFAQDEGLDQIYASVWRGSAAAKCPLYSLGIPPSPAGDEDAGEAGDPLVVF